MSAGAYCLWRHPAFGWLLVRVNYHWSNMVQVLTETGAVLAVRPGELLPVASGEHGARIMRRLKAKRHRHCPCSSCRKDQPNHDHRRT
jgi:hypothetical protein